ncbi:MAG TPA: protein rep [Polyangiaceae bacterium]
MGASGRAHYGGLLRCGSVWACPVCGSAIRAGRAEEVRRAVERHGSKRALLLSLTVRHGLGHALRGVRQGVAKAWTRMIRGAPWKRFAKRIGLVGLIRALEVTHGPENGWHPHIHALVLTGRTLDDAEVSDAAIWLSERWQECVQRALGEEHRPDYAHGCDLRSCHSADYIAKLGLELTAPGRSKRAKRQNRTPMEIAYDFVTEGLRRDADLWTDFCESMYGARMLTWSRNLRRKLGLPTEVSDDDLAQQTETNEILALIPGQAWDAMRDTLGVRSALLEAAEREGLDGVIALVNRLSSGFSARGSPLD